MLSPNRCHRWIAKVKNYNVNATEVRDSNFKNAFPGILNFTVGILLRAQKCEPLWQKSRDQYFEETIKEKMSGSNVEPSQIQIHMLARVMVSFDDFLSHSSRTRFSVYSIHLV